MRVHRKTLYVGVFLLAMGGVLLIAQGGALDPETVRQALRLWPLLFIGLGAALLLRRTRLGLAGGMVAAALPGLLLGGLVAAAPDLEVDCAGRSVPAGVVREGTFGGRAVIDLELACGDLDLTNAPGRAWRVAVGEAGGKLPTITASGDRLTVVSSDRDHRFGPPWGGESWVVTLPTEVALDLGLSVDAGRADLDLRGAAVERLRLEVNAGAARIVLPDGADSTVDLSVDAGSLDVCVPAGLGVRLVTDGDLNDIEVAGFIRSGEAWETPGYATTTHHAEVTVEANLASVDIQLEGDCT